MSISYEPLPHRLVILTEKDVRQDLARTCLSQMCMGRAPVSLVITAEYSRICRKYGERGKRYTLIEAGHSGQNIFLQAEALDWEQGLWRLLRMNRWWRSWVFPRPMSRS